MRQKIYLCAVISVLFLSGFSLNSFPQQSKPLQFSKEGKLKIVQFTDFHFIADDPRSTVSLQCIDDVLSSEQPDLVVVTGDVIYGKPAEKSMCTVLTQISKHKIPFAVVYGNHDDEFGMSRKELLDVIRSIPYSLTETTEGISGVTNYIVPVKSADGTKNEFTLYFIDSNAYSTISDVKGYDFVRFDQIAWYREQSAGITKQNGGVPVPALAFLHIPVPEFGQAASEENARFVGTRKEGCGCSRLNSGLFTSMKEMGDVLSIFAGHEHDNDYAVAWHGILLAYGRYSGGNTVYNHLENGARVIELTVGKKGFDSWIRLKNNVVINKISFPEDFIF